MEYKRNYYHFNCVCDYGYNKFCIEILNNNQKINNQEINNQEINNIKL